MLKVKNTIPRCLYHNIVTNTTFINPGRLVSKISHRLYILWLLNSNWNKAYVYLCTRSSRFSVQMYHRTRMYMVSDVESKIVDYWTELHMWKSYYVRYRQSKGEQGYSFVLLKCWNTFAYLITIHTFDVFETRCPVLWMFVCRVCLHYTRNMT